MPTVVLLTKVHSNFQCSLIDRFLKAALADLKFEAKIRRTTRRDWAQLEVSGEDEKVALRYLEKQIGFCPIRLEDLESPSTVKGYASNAHSDGNALLVDIGVFMPDTINAYVSLPYLQAQLADGRKIALRKLVSLYGFCEGFPLDITVTKIRRKENRIEAVLAERQLRRYRDWSKSLLDRLVVLGASLEGIKWALNDAECGRDVAEIETLGLLDHAVVCKLGTDAAGLIPKIGQILRRASFSVFSPRRVMEFLES